MKTIQAVFLKSAAKFEQCPPDTGAEVAFVGRSNAGKSSALNVLTAQRKLARVSKTPGRTQLINFFALGEAQRLVDLPGYGYAKAARTQRRAWQNMINDYLQQRQSLKGLILLVDSRHLFKDSDYTMMGWATISECPIHILLTKADKLSRGVAAIALQQAKKQLLANNLPASIQLFSATKKQGLEDCHQQLQCWFEMA